MENCESVTSTTNTNTDDSIAEAVKNLQIDNDITKEDEDKSTLQQHEAKYFLDILAQYKEAVKHKEKHAAFLKVFILSMLCIVDISLSILSYVNEADSRVVSYKHNDKKNNINLFLYRTLLLDHSSHFQWHPKMQKLSLKHWKLLKCYWKMFKIIIDYKIFCIS